MALEPHLDDSNLTVGRAARICGIDHRRLARALRSRGTTISREIANLREEKAAGQLIGTELSVAVIGESVGFTDPTVFSRAFKRWTGQSPQEYRRMHKSPE
jgi:AraC-like DNA-binding protein